MKTSLNTPKSVRFVVDAFCTNDCGTSPPYAVFDACPEFLDKLASLVALCVSHELTELKVDGAPSWGTEDFEEDLCLLSPEMVVRPCGSFWFTDEPNYAEYSIESRAADLLAVRAAFDAAEDGAVVFLTECASVKQQFLADNEPASGSDPTVE